MAGAVASKKPRDVKVRERAERVRTRRRREIGIWGWEAVGLVAVSAWERKLE